MSKIKDKPFFKWPNAMPSDPSRRDPEKYCSYHKDHGHMTEKCKSLKFFLEGLVKRGLISEFVKEAGTHRRNAEPDNELPEQNQNRTDGVINVIHGVLDSSTLTKNAIRHSQRKVRMQEYIAPQVVMSVASEKRPRDGERAPQQLSFSDRDLQGVEVPHNDALVVMLKISTWEVRRVLIDPGSSSEIMYRNLYRSLNIPPKDIIPVNSPVFSFSGEAVWPVGRVRLPVRVGPTETVMEFLICDIDAPYNAIMGRNWLGAIRAVASPYHQKLKFPSPEGIVELRGNQEQARLCFYMAVRGADLANQQVKNKGKGKSEQVQEVLAVEDGSSDK